jgi:hypothetical protein
MRGCGLVVQVAFHLICMMVNPLFATFLGRRSALPFTAAMSNLFFRLRLALFDPAFLSARPVKVWNRFRDPRRGLHPMGRKANLVGTHHNLASTVPNRGAA